MTELEILYVNICLYVSAFIFFKAKHGFLNLSTICILFYLLGSIISLFFYLTPVYNFTFSNDGKLSIEGMLWLFSFNFLLCYLLRYFSFPKSEVITSYNKGFVDKVQNVLVVAFVIILIFDLPISLTNISSQNLADLRDTTYVEGGHGSKFFLVDLLQRAFSELILILLAIALFNILVLKRKRKIDVYSIVVYFLILVDTMAMFISRSIIVYRLIGVVILLILLRHFIKIRFFKYVFLIGLPIVISLSYFFNTVTSSRFGKTSAESQAELFANLRYAGEPQVNFIGLMYDKTDGLAFGYRSLPLFRKLLGLEYFGQVGSNKDDNLVFLDKIHPHPNYILYTAAGDWYLDLGRYLPLMLLLILNYLVYINRNKNREFDFFNFILAVIMGFYAINGVFYSQFQNEPGNFLIIFLVIFYYKNRRYSYSMLKRGAFSYIKTKNTLSRRML